MKRIEYRDVIDKSEWGPGPWQKEPDKIQWQDKKTGLLCLIIRNRWVGSLNGYVGVVKGHPLCGVDFHDLDLHIHGGLSFSGYSQTYTKKDYARFKKDMLKCKEEIRLHPDGDAANYWKDAGHLMDDYEEWVKHFESTGICDKTPNGEKHKVWWFGFDCAHLWDLCPGLQAILKKHKTNYFQKSDIYRDIKYVKAEVENLALTLNGDALISHRKKRAEKRLGGK